MPSATQKMLTQQLRALETRGIVSRKIYPEVPPVVEYSLTDIGRKLGPVLQDINTWAIEYLAGQNSSTK